MATTGSIKQMSRPGTGQEPPSTTGLLNLEVPSIQRFAGIADIITPPSGLEVLDINQGMVIDILLRLAYNEGEVGATHAEEIVKLPYRLIDDMLAWMQQEHLLEVSKAVGSLGRRGYVYNLTDAGRARARSI
jgi:hypothetical protein